MPATDVIRRPKTSAFLHHYGKVFQAKIILADYLSRLEHPGKDAKGVIDGIITTIEKSLHKEELIVQKYETELFNSIRGVVQRRDVGYPTPSGTTEIEDKIRNSEDLKNILHQQKDALQRLKLKGSAENYNAFFTLVTKETNELNTLDLLSKHDIEDIRTHLAELNKKHNLNIPLPDEPVAFEPVKKKQAPAKPARQRVTYEQLQQMIARTSLDPLDFQQIGNMRNLDRAQKATVEKILNDYGIIVERISTCYFYHHDYPNMTGDCAQAVIDSLGDYASPSDILSQICFQLKQLLTGAFRSCNFDDIQVQDTANGTQGTLFLLYYFRKGSLFIPFAPFGKASYDGRSVSFPGGPLAALQKPGTITTLLRNAVVVRCVSTYQQ